MSYTTTPQGVLQGAGLSDAEIALGYEPGDLSDAEIRDIARRAGMKWLEADGEEGGFPGAFDLATIDEVRKLVELARSKPPVQGTEP